MAELAVSSRPAARRPTCGACAASKSSTRTSTTHPRVAQDELIDTERLLPGASGVIDARAFLTVLDEIDFDGPTLVEPFNAEVRAPPPEGRVAAVAASLESVWP
jgi:sugar phosphate isomerase/epimerase